jgi:hypothetical protein
MNPDILYSPFTFSATQITIEAITPKGREIFEDCFGLGAVSATLPKSKAADFLHFVGRACVVAEIEPV